MNFQSGAELTYLNVLDELDKVIRDKKLNQLTIQQLLNKIGINQKIIITEINSINKKVA